MTRTAAGPPPARTLHDSRGTDHKPGDLLNGEISASDRLQVSRGAYREAVRILAAKGLVESRPKVGTRVSRPENWHLLDPDVLSWIFQFAFIISMTSGVGAAISWTTVFKQRDNPLARDPLPDHRRVFEAVKAADPDAAHEAMENLVDLALLDTTNARKSAR